MLLRESQRKFRVPGYGGPSDLRVVSTSADGYSRLCFQSVLKAFESSNANTEENERTYEDTYNHLQRISSTDLDYLREIFRISNDERGGGLKARHLLLKLAIRLKENDVFPEDYTGSFLMLYLAKLAERAWNTDLFKDRNKEVGLESSEA